MHLEKVTNLETYKKAVSVSDEIIKRLKALQERMLEQTALVTRNQENLGIAQADLKDVLARISEGEDLSKELARARRKLADLETALKVDRELLESMQETQTLLLEKKHAALTDVEVARRKTLSNHALVHKAEVEKSLKSALSDFQLCFALERGKLMGVDSVIERLSIGMGAEVAERIRVAHGSLQQGEV